jgi:hypothetical protein
VVVSHLSFGFFFLLGGTGSLGTWNSETCQEFPKTYQLLKDLNIPLAVRGVCFAKQAPQSGVQPHSDGRNFILTSHLGIQIPNETINIHNNNTNIHNNTNSSCCWIQVGPERRTWQRGKLLTLDTSFVHSTGNDSPDQERHVLIIDFWHPELTEAERVALTFIYNLRNKFESGQIPPRKPNQRIWQNQLNKQTLLLLPKQPEGEKQEQQVGNRAEAAGVLSTWWKNLAGGTPVDE